MEETREIGKALCPERTTPVRDALGFTTEKPGSIRRAAAPGALTQLTVTQAARSCTCLTRSYRREGSCDFLLLCSPLVFLIVALCPVDLRDRLTLLSPRSSLCLYSLILSSRPSSSSSSSFSSIAMRYINIEYSCLRASNTYFSLPLAR